MAKDNALAIRPLSQLAQFITSAGQSLYQAPRDNIQGIDAAGWYSPGQPVKPLAPADIEPRGFQYWAGQNLMYTPRPDAEYAAAELKRLSTYVLARICIENTKDVICKLKWSIQLRQKPGESKKDRQKREAGDSNIVKLSRFFEYPDNENDWSAWLRPIIEDMLVIDAASILNRRTKNGQIIELRVAAGEMFTRYIDQQGYTPRPPDPAYAQNWWGLPLVDLTTEQLIYRPRNIVRRNTLSSQLYGMSPVEQAAEEISLGWERLKWLTTYFTAGSIPDMMMIVKEGIDPKRMAEAMTWMNSDLAGNMAKRHQFRYVQGFTEDGSDQIVQKSPEKLSDLFDELHIRKVCFAFGTSPQRLMKQMNRASAQQADSAAQDEGVEPFVNWLKRSAIDYVIQRLFKLPDYEISFDLERPTDPLKQAEADKIKISVGQFTRNETREALGQDASNEPGSDALTITTATGVASIDPDNQPQPASSPLAASGLNGQPKPAQPGANGKPPAKEPDKKPATAPAAAKARDDGRLTAFEAGYVEFPDAAKDGDCLRVFVDGGVSRDGGCCNVFDKTDIVKFSCGTCTQIAPLVEIPPDLVKKKSLQLSY